MICTLHYFCLFLLISSSLFSFTIEEKVGQLLIVHFHGEKANEASKILLEQAHSGGFIYYDWANGLTSPEQVRTLSAGLQKCNPSSLPLFIAVDQEGGRVSRFKKGFPAFPSQSNTKDGLPAQEIAILLKEVEINLNFAPVVDVNSNPQNPIIGDRSYSHDPEEVVRLGRLALKAYHEKGILATLKHFPGHGDTESDSHSSLPIVNKSLEELNRVELYPFKELSPETDLIMTAHLLMPALDAEFPATFSSRILTGLLRNSWDYQGLIISDSLIMKALDIYAPSIEEKALLALNAGCDLLCLGGKLLNEPAQDEFTVEDILRIHSYLVEAVKSGRYPEEKLNASFERIRHAKRKLLEQFRM